MKVVSVDESADSKSASSQTIDGESTLSSEVHLFSLEEAKPASCLQTRTDYVKLILRTISDANNYSEISAVFSEKKSTILLVTHDQNEAELMTERRLIMEKGSFV